MNILIKSAKIFGIIILTFVITVVAQNVAILWHLLDLKSVETILHGLTYAVITFLLIKWFIQKGLKQELRDYRLTRFKLSLDVIVIGLSIPVIVILICIIFIPGSFVVTRIANPIDYCNMLFEIVFLGGIFSPIAEEILVRGLLMGYIEKQTNITTAIMISSVLFAVVHLFNGGMSGGSLILLLTSGTIAGMLYGLIAYKYQSIWASACLHICWNLSDLCHISTNNEQYGIVQYIVETKNIWITGGAYGNSASVISMLIFLMAIFLILKKKAIKY